MNFDEWKEKNLAKGESKSWIEWCEESYQAGAQSQQAKIDILQIKLNGADERAAAVLNHKNKMIDELQAKIDDLQRKIAFQEKAIKNIKLQFENKQIDCDRSDRKINELQGRIDEAVGYVSESAGVNLTSEIALNDILEGNKDETGLN